MAALRVSGGSARSTGTNKLNIRPTYEATTCPYIKGPSPIENTFKPSNKLGGEQQYTGSFINILLTKKLTQVGNYINNRRTRRIYTRVVLVSKRDQETPDKWAKEEKNNLSAVMTHHHHKPWFHQLSHQNHPTYP